MPPRAFTFPALCTLLALTVAACPRVEPPTTPGVSRCDDDADAGDCDDAAGSTTMRGPTPEPISPPEPGSTPKPNPKPAPKPPAPAAPCVCTREYKPVCGHDGKSYGNACEARCAAADIDHEGECASSGCQYEGRHYASGEAFPASDGCNDCSCGSDGAVVCTLALCACDYQTGPRRWVEKSGEKCKAVRFACKDGERPFFEDCGCGCEPDAQAATACKVGGCSSQLCVDASSPGVVSTCEWREEYACYRDASCEPQANGRCGWTETDALKNCLDGAR